MPIAFFARINGKMERIFFRDILYVAAKKNYSEIVMCCGRKVCVYLPLSGLQEQLPVKHFCRVHRSYLVCTEHIAAFDRSYVWLGAQKVPIGRSYFEQLTKALLIICGEHELENNKKAKAMVGGGGIRSHRQENRG